MIGPKTLADDLRQRINPLYASQKGTESYERRECAEAIERLLSERDRLREALAAIIDLSNDALVMHRARRALEFVGGAG